MNETNYNEEKSIDIKYILSIVKHQWKLYLASVIICLAAGYIYTYNKTRLYQITAKVLLKDNEKGTFSSQSDMLADFGFQATNTNVENEIEVLNSKSVVQAAVMHSGLYTQYSIKGFLSSTPIYKNTSPLQLTILEEDLKELSAPLFFEFSLNADSTYEVIYRYSNEAEGLEIETVPAKIESFPFILNTEKGEILLTENTKGVKFEKFTATIYPVDAVVGAYKSALAISPISKTASVSIIAINDAVPANGVDFINALIYSYNRQADEDKNIIARKTEDFITARIELVGKDLKGKEENLATYKKQNQIISPEMDAPQVLQGHNEYVKKLDEVKMQLQQAEHLLQYISDPKNDMQAIPTVLGLSSEPTLSNLVARYNVEVASRNQLLLSATEENPILQSTTDGVKRTRNDILDALNTIKSSLEIRKTTLTGLTNKYALRAAETPGIERMYTDLVRERDIKSQLYVMLLQKYEENALALALTVDNLKCIDPASVHPAPVSPNKRLILMMALFIGIAVPSAFLYLRELLRTKINSLEELENLATVPVVGSIPLKKEIADSNSPIAIRENENNIMSEAFRSLRANLHFMLQENGKVIMFTSTTSGEGKTFVSSNFAISLAMIGKKVLLMGLDIRCPMLSKVFNLPSKAKGITSYLAGSEENLELLDSLISSSDIIDTLDVLPAGIIPPNPAELLAKNNIYAALEHLKSKYDYIIIDSAPVGLVSDSLILGKTADSTVLISRYNYTEKSDIEFLNSLVQSGKLNNVSIILNAIDIKKASLYKQGKYKYVYSQEKYSNTAAE